MECVFDLTGRQHVRTVTRGEPHRNVHGQSEFMLKVQLPFDRATFSPDPFEGARALCYDQTRSFNQQYFRPAEHGAAGKRLFELVQRADLGGANGPRGVKAYLMARREGQNIRVFVDQCAPPPLDW